MKIKCAILVLISVISGFVAMARAEPTEFNNQYKAKKYGFTVNVTYSLKKISSSEYELLLDADSSIAHIKEQSRMRWDEAAGVFYPIDYSFARRVLGKEKNVKIHFDWQQRTIHDELKNVSRAMPENINIQDELSYQAQMQQDLLAGKQAFVYQVADEKHTETYVFKLDSSNEQIKTALGKINTVKLIRDHGKGGRVTIAWLAKEWGSFLVSLEHQEKGSSYRMELKKASLANKTIDKF